MTGSKQKRSRTTAFGQRPLRRPAAGNRPDPGAAPDEDDRDEDNPGVDNPDDEIVRRRIKALILGRKGESYATVSTMLGRNLSYIHQYITRGSPKSLREDDRRKIARYFGVPRRDLLLPDDEDSTTPDADSPIVMLDVWPVTARADGRAGAQSLPFRRDWLEGLFPSASLVAMFIAGDAMAPTLANGSLALVDRTETMVQRDGVYILRAGDEILPRRLSRNPLTGRITIAADNRLYPGQDNCDPASLSILGRVVWVGQRL